MNQPSEAQQKQIDQLRWNLTNHTPTAEGIRKIEAIRSTAKAFGEAIIMLTPPSREQSIALTKLEEADMWAVKAIVLEEKVED